MPYQFSALHRGQPKIPLYTAKQIYAIEHAWFETGNDSYALMQQAAWGVANWVYQHLPSLVQTQDNAHHSLKQQSPITIDIWIGSGNNGGDGWCVARFLQQLTRQLPDNNRTAEQIIITVIEVADPTTFDSQQAKTQALKAGVARLTIDDWQAYHTHPYAPMSASAYRPDVILDALFGIGLSRVPTGDYATAIYAINQAKQMGANLVALDIPSGLNASTGQVYQADEGHADEKTVAIQANVTLCLLARKIGLHIKAGRDYAGKVVDLPLIPVCSTNQTQNRQSPTAWLINQPHALPKRQQDTHKGSFGHVLIVGGNQLANGQGMGGASILSAEACFAVGAGKVSVACHKDYHASLLARVPHAMCLDLQALSKAKPDSIEDLTSSCNVMAIGMGLGRDDECQAIFCTYLQMGMDANLDMVIDADGLYHLATLAQHNDELCQKLKTFARSHAVYFTPHSGEAGRLLGVAASDVEANRMSAIMQLASQFGGAWLLKGAGSLVMEGGNCYVCDVGNAGMATAGMGDVLSGMASGLLAQSTLPKPCQTLRQAVLIHGRAGDGLASRVGQYGLDASMMGEEITGLLTSVYS